MCPEISVASVNSSADNSNVVLTFIDRMLDNISSSSEPIEPELGRLNTWPTRSQTFANPQSSPRTMTSTPIHPATGTPPGETNLTTSFENDEGPPRTLSSPRNPRCTGRSQGWRGGRNHSSYHREPNSDAMNAFTRFFHAEAQAKELATRKEAHVFDQQVRAEREQGRSRRPDARQSSHHLSLDNRAHHRGPPLRAHPPNAAVRGPAPTRTAAPPTVAQVIAAANSAHQCPTPVTSSPNPTVLDTGRDVLEIVAATEQMDLDTEEQIRSSFLGRVNVILWMLLGALTPLAWSAAFGSMQPTLVSEPMLVSPPSPAPSA
ncbi:hypothetical protein M405DRAFT_889215 [Rhizopogon salebrosus TDB-379]|nr:hypothetical protein M405DRAFT_889215 [Rhizopogon salebrosus TDB-379]